MFGKNPETLSPSQLAPEEKQHLLDEALSRIEVAEGVEYLDGFPLPPANDELWQPRSYSMDVTCMAEKNGEIYIWAERLSEFESTTTNAFVRDANISCLAMVIAPLFMTREQISQHGERFWPNIKKPSNIREGVKKRLSSFAIDHSS